VITSNGRLRITKLDANGQPTGESTLVDHATISNITFSERDERERLLDDMAEALSVAPIVLNVRREGRDPIRVQATVGEPVREIKGR